MFIYISYNFKNELHFYTSVGGLGQLIQANYMIILEGVITSS
jgi:hypothetical protein